MSGKPYQSSLIPYENEIVSLRRKRPPVSYSRIAELLRDKYQIVIGKKGIQMFIKRRVKKVYKPCKYDAWDIDLPEVTCQPASQVTCTSTPESACRTTTQVTCASKPKAAPPSLQVTSHQPSVSDKPKPKAAYQPEPFEEVMTYSETYNLTRLSPEEAEAINKQLEEEERNRR